MRFPARAAVLLFAFFIFHSPTNAAAQAASKKNLIILGDSLAAGYGVEAEEAWPALLQKKIDAAGLNFAVVNSGVSGNTTSDGLQRLNWLLRRKADVLLLELGGNDGLRGLPVALIQTNLQSIIDSTRRKYPGVKIVIAGMQMPPSMGLDYVRAYDRVFSAVAAKNHTDLIPFILDGVGGRPELNLPDGIHPTPEGHKIVAETVWKTMRPVLASF